MNKEQNEINVGEFIQVKPAQKSDRSLQTKKKYSIERIKHVVPKVKLNKENKHLKVLKNIVAESVLTPEENGLQSLRLNIEESDPDE